MNDSLISSGEKNIDVLLKSMKPRLNAGEYVFCTVQNLSQVLPTDCLMMFQEAEGTTLILAKEVADTYKFQYSYIASWITLTVHSSLEAVGLTAAFSGALALENISCNVVAGYFHDHLFVDKKDAERAMQILQRFCATN
ncbi:ACT domain-containing protein [Rudanella lutea]|uniref:ACT domain-containing protein n=1 Tax=Rudanella lutea TaxID=451374 RepID=UPI000371CF51|nr:ACT domain-containing protein [Rudanella lutea]